MSRAGAVWACGLAVWLALAALPLAGQGYHLELLTGVFFWVGLAGCWNFMSGYTGYIDFGAVTYVGVGAYTGGLLIMNAGWALTPALAAAGALAALLALAVGLPTLRLRGAYFAIATFALAEAARQVCLEWASLTGGGLGLTITTRLAPLAYYWAYLALAGAMVGLTRLMSRGRLGLALTAIRQDEAAARRIGVNAHGAKLAAYGLSAMFAGVLGALDATRLTYITPADAFDVHVTIKMIIMTLLGGAGTVLGPVVGAALLQSLEDFLGARFLSLYLAMVGAAIVAVIMFLPRGVLGGLRGRK